MSTTVASVVNHFPSAENGFTTTLASTIASGATTVPLNSVAGYANGEIAVFVVDPSDASKKQTFTGVIDTSGVQVTGVVWTAGTNQTHAGGATVVDYATATHISMMTKGILVHADQDGTLKSGAVDVAAVLADGVVTPAKLTSGTGSSWDWQSYVPVLSGTGGSPTLGNGSIAGQFAQIGKTVLFKIKITAGSTTAFGSSITTVSLPVTANSTSFDARTLCGTLEFFDTSAPGAYWGTVAIATSTTIDLYVDNTATAYRQPSNITTAVPTAVGAGDIIRITGLVEVA